MDTRTGDIYDFESQTETLQKLRERLKRDVDELIKHLVPAAEVRPGQIRAKKVGRNGPCPCGSGKKFKKCCMDRAATNAERAAIAEAIKERINED